MKQTITGSWSELKPGVTHLVIRNQPWFVRPEAPSFEEMYKAGATVEECRAARSRNEWFQKGDIPDTVTQLEFWFVLPAPLEPGVIPDSVTELTFALWEEDRTRAYTGITTIPPSIEDMGSYGYAGPRYVVFPPWEKGMIPASVTNLQLTIPGYQKVDADLIPDSVRTLSLVGRYKNLKIPNSVENLTLGFAFPELEVPDSVTHLQIHGSSNGFQPPESVTHLGFYRRPEEEIMEDTYLIPSSIQQLTFSKDYFGYLTRCYTWRGYREFDEPFFPLSSDLSQAERPKNTVPDICYCFEDLKINLARFPHLDKVWVDGKEYRAEELTPEGRGQKRQLIATLDCPQIVHSLDLIQPGIQHLIFEGSLDKPLTPGSIPASVTTLELNCFIEVELKPGDIPNTVTNLTLHTPHSNYRVYGAEARKAWKKKEYIHPHSREMSNFTQTACPEIRKGAIPNSVTHLTLDVSGPQVLEWDEYEYDFTIIPDSVTHLWLKRTAWKQAIPKSVTHVWIGKTVCSPTYIPDTVQHVTRE